MRGQRLLFGILALAYLVFIGTITLTPDPFSDDVDGIIGTMIDVFSRNEMTAWLTYDVVEFTANIGMFVPLGALVALCIGARQWWIAAVIGVTCSLGIETYQGIVLAATRYATIGDVIANSIGALIGALAVRAVAGVVNRRRARRAAPSEATMPGASERREFC